MYVTQGCDYPGTCSRWAKRLCLDTTKIDVDSFKRCFASRIAHMHNVHNVRTYVRNTHQCVYCEHSFRL